MTTYSWNGTAATDFSDPANWIDEATGMPGGVPGAQDTALLSGTGLITGTGTVAAIDLLASAQGHSSYHLEGTFSSTSVSVLGELDVTGASTLRAQTIDVGSAASLGILTVADGTLGALAGRLDVTVSDGSAAAVQAELDVGEPYAQGYGSGILGELALGSGVLRVGSGAGQSGRLAVGGGLIEGGAASAIVVGQDAASGTLTTSGAPWDIVAGKLVLGASGTGQATLASGGTLLLGHGSGLALVLGDRAGLDPTLGSGSLTATGVQVTVDGVAEIGRAGQGSASFSSTMLNTEMGLVIGDAATAQGTVTLDGAAWTDTDAVIVGGAGRGSLLVSSFGQNSGPYGQSVINGALLVGAYSGSGTVSLEGALLDVHGNTVLGASHANTLSLQGATLDSAGVILRDQAAINPVPDGDLVTLSAGSTLAAGFLSVGLGDAVVAAQNGTIALGSAAASAAGAISGNLILGQGSTLTALGSLQVEQSRFGAQTDGLNLFGATAELTSSAGPALTLRDGGVAAVQSGLLDSHGGILATGGGVLMVNGGTVTTSSAGTALDVAADGIVVVQGGTLDTQGVLSLNDGGARTIQSQGGSLRVQSGTLTSTAAAPDGLAVRINGGSAALSAATWTVDGRFDVGTAPRGGALSVQGGTVDIAGTLQVGTFDTHGQVATADTDTVVSGGTLPAGQTGIAADRITVGGDGSITTGTLQVGSATARGAMVVNGEVSVSAQATVNGRLGLAGHALLQAAALTITDGSTVAGSGTIAAPVANDGTIRVTPGTLSCLGPVGGTGTLTLAGGTLVLAQGEAAGVGVTFAAAGTLSTPSVADLAGPVSGWQAGDTILFTGQHVASDSFANGTLSLFGSGHALLGTAVFGGALTASNFVLAGAQGTGTVLSYHG